MLSFWIYRYTLRREIGLLQLASTNWYLFNSTPSWLIRKKRSRQRRSVMFSCLVKQQKLKVFCMRMEMSVHLLSIEMKKMRRWKVQGYLDLLLERQWEQMNNLSCAEVQEWESCMKEKNLTPKKSFKKMRMMMWNPIEEDMALGLYHFMFYVFWIMMHSCELCVLNLWPVVWLFF